MADIDFEDGIYTVEGSEGVAWRAIEYVTHMYPVYYIEHDEDGEEYEVESDEWEEVPDFNRVVMRMIGDRTRFEFGVDEITPIKQGEFCWDCGSTICTWHTGSAE